jgi:hypothetical protein
VRKTYWVFTDQSLFELVVGNEDRDIWKIYLGKGQFDVALRYAKVWWKSLESGLVKFDLLRLPHNVTKS